MKAFELENVLSEMREKLEVRTAFNPPKKINFRFVFREGDKVDRSLCRRPHSVACGEHSQLGNCVVVSIGEGGTAGAISDFVMNLCKATDKVGNNVPVLFLVSDKVLTMSSNSILEDCYLPSAGGAYTTEDGSEGMIELEMFKPYDYMMGKYRHIPLSKLQLVLTAELVKMVSNASGNERASRMATLMELLSHDFLGLEDDDGQE